MRLDLKDLRLDLRLARNDLELDLRLDPKNLRLDVKDLRRPTSLEIPDSNIGLCRVIMSVVKLLPVCCIAVEYKNSSGDEIANVNFYAVRP